MYFVYIEAMKINHIIKHSAWKYEKDAENQVRVLRLTGYNNIFIEFNKELKIENAHYFI